MKVLDDGFVKLVDSMGSDSAIVQAARISYGSGDSKNNKNLIRYLMRHRHTTPFEMVEFKFHVRVPMDCWRQWIRHRTASVNEYSTRYTTAIDSMAVTGTWRLQNTDNKQGSKKGEVSWPKGTENKVWEGEPVLLLGYGFEISEGMTCYCLNDEPIAPDNTTPEEHLTVMEHWHQVMAKEIYEERLTFGVAKEQARKDLPLSNYTEAYWKCDLHNIFHFLGLRLDSHAQQEIREYAKAIALFVEQKCPMAYEAFEDYRLDGLFLSGPEVESLKSGIVMLEGRELTEFKEKTKRLDFVIEGKEVCYKP